MIGAYPKAPNTKDSSSPPFSQESNFAVSPARVWRYIRRTMNTNTVLWLYILLLMDGGLFGFLKAGSKVSLITSAVSAALLILTLTGIFDRHFARVLADVIMAALLVVFAIRLSKTRKFMPSGLMLAVTAVALAFRHLL